MTRYEYIAQGRAGAAKPKDGRERPSLYARRQLPCCRRSYKTSPSFDSIPRQQTGWL